MKRRTAFHAWCALSLATVAGCSSLGPPLQGARTGEKIVRTTEKTTFARIAEIAYADSTLGPSVAGLAGMPVEGGVPTGTVLVLPPRDRLETRVREAELAWRETTAVSIAPDDVVLSQKERREIAALYESGERAMAEGRVDDALQDWELVWRRNPAWPGVTDRLKEEYLVRGLDAFSNDRLDEAVTLWQRALEIDPSDGRAGGYLQRAREQQARSDEILGTGAAQ